MAKIDFSLIEGFDNMTAEEKLKALEDFEYDDNAAELEKYKNAASKNAKEAAENKRKYKELLSETEKAELEKNESLEEIQKELAELKKEKTVSGYVASLLSQGFSEKGAKEGAQALADGDMAKYFEISKKEQEEAAKKLKADLMKNMGKPPAGKEGEIFSLDDLKKMSPDERLRFYQEHPEEYKNLYGGNK